jgi:hypothetical protein
MLGMADVTPRCAHGAVPFGGAATAPEDVAGYTPEIFGDPAVVETIQRLHRMPQAFLTPMNDKASEAGRVVYGVLAG